MWHAATILTATVLLLLLLRHSATASPNQQLDHLSQPPLILSSGSLTLTYKPDTNTYAIDLDGVEYILTTDNCTCSGLFHSVN